MQPIYTADAIVTGGRSGRACIAGGPGHLDLALPDGFGGSGDAGYNPEQLFAAAYGASFGAVLDLEARQLGLQLDEITVAPSVSIGHGDSGYFVLDIVLRVQLHGADRKTAEKLAQAAHTGCPYSRMLRGHVDVEVIVEEPELPSGIKMD